MYTSKPHFALCMEADYGRGQEENSEDQFRGCFMQERVDGGLDCGSSKGAVIRGQI